ncbi:MAG: hypothetical protein PHC99_02445 [Methylococcales bacterium]|nr:hypothetical protein [Methylococcales bacterium]
MIDSLIYRFKLHKLFSQREKISHDFAQHYKLAKNASEERDLWDEEKNELNIIDYEIEMLTTSYYLKIAKRKFLEIHPEYWVGTSLDPDNNVLNQRVLSNKAIKALKMEIRADRKENLTMFTSMISAITGLAGVVIGLIAFIGGK